MSQTPIKVLLADDEAGMRMILRKIIERVDGFALAGEAENGRALLDMVRAQRPQVVFLDVDMPEMSGVECARQIQDEDPSIVLIFATGHEEYMGEAFAVYAFDYLVKPFKMERVVSTLERVRDRILRAPDADALPVPQRPKAAPGRLMLRHKDGVTFVDADDILLVQREERATVLYAEGDKRYVLPETLGETEARLDKGVFFRCHKSYIINLNKIDSILPYGRWTYVVKLSGTKHDALITHDKYEELEKMFA